MLQGEEYRKWIQGHMTIGKEILYLTEAECRAIEIPEETVFDLTERALILYSEKKAEMPPKVAVHPLKDTFCHAMPASVEDMSSMGMKWVSCYPSNKAVYGIGQTNALIIFNDYLSGVPLAIMDGRNITELRTACVSFASAKYMARPDAKTFGMIGCGVQGRAHVKIACNTLTKLEKIYVYDMLEAACDSLINDLQPKVKCEIVKAKSIEELALSCQVIATATVIPARPEPQIRDEWITKGQTLLLCDAHSLVEDATAKRADKYTLDSIGQHRLMATYDYYPYGLPEIYGEIGEVCGGYKKGRERDDELIVCNNIGMAVEDMIVIRVLFDKALETKKGRLLPL